MGETLRDWTPASNTERSARQGHPGAWVEVRRDTVATGRLAGRRCALLHPPGHPDLSRWVPVEQLTGS